MTYFGFGTGHLQREGIFLKAETMCHRRDGMPKEIVKNGDVNLYGTELHACSSC